MNFVITCLSHTSSLVKYVAHHSIRFGLNFSLVGRNVLYCSRRYGFDVSDVLTNNARFLSDTYIRVRDLKLLKFKCMRLICCLSVLIRDSSQAALPCGFLGQMYNRL